MIRLPGMPDAQQAAWEALFEIHEATPQYWTLVGGQAVFLHTVERSAAVVRPTTDADAALNLRLRPDILEKFTATLASLGFKSSGTSPEGHQHRWERGIAVVDVLIPRWTGERAEKRHGISGGTTIAAPGLQQALDRSETVEVDAAGSVGLVNRADFLGCLIGKAAALRIMIDPGRERHLTDALSLAATLRRGDIRGVVFGPAEKAHLANLVGHLRANAALVERHPTGPEALERLAALAAGWNPTDPNA